MIKAIPSTWASIYKMGMGEIMDSLHSGLLLHEPCMNLKFAHCLATRTAKKNINSKTIKTGTARNKGNDILRTA
jgi:hypothetical protein